MHGGSRPNSGRKKGRKTDVARGLARKKAIQTAEEIIGGGLTPLKYLISVMRNTKKPVDVRIDAAKAAAPYIHRKQPQDVILQAAVHIEGVDINIVGKD